VCGEPRHRDGVGRSAAEVDGVFVCFTSGVKRAQYSYRLNPGLHGGRINAHDEEGSGNTALESAHCELLSVIFQTMTFRRALLRR